MPREIEIPEIYTNVQTDSHTLNKENVMSLSNINVYKGIITAE
jgi:hypothetical protein